MNLKELIFNNFSFAGITIIVRINNTVITFLDRFRIFFNIHIIARDNQHR